MTEGTKSFLFGCHQFFIHPVLVAIAWKKRYGAWPTWSELVCIAIHDIGLLGKEYLTFEKDGHWRRGAYRACLWFGWDAWLLCGGHTDESRFPRSRLFYADKCSCLYAPRWWLHWCTYLEGFKNLSGVDSKRWKELVAENARLGFPRDSHQIYLDERKKFQKGG